MAELGGTTRRWHGARGRARAVRVIVAVVVLAALRPLLGGPAAADDGVALAKATTTAYPTVVLAIDAPADAGPFSSADVLVTENGVPQTAGVSRLAGAGLEVVLVVDASEAAGVDGLDAFRQAAGALAARLPAEVHVGVVGYGDGVRVHALPTASRDTVAQALDALTPGGAAPLYDAVAVAGRLFTPGARERLVVLLAAAGDDASAVTIDDAAAAVRGSYLEVLSLESPLTSPLALARLAIEGRGDVAVATDAAGVAAAGAALGDTLLGRHIVTYTSSGHGPVVLEVATPVGALSSPLELPPAPVAAATTVPAPPATSTVTAPAAVAPDAPAVPEAPAVAAPSSAVTGPRPLPPSPSPVAPTSTVRPVTVPPAAARPVTVPRATVPPVTVGVDGAGPSGAGGVPSWLAGAALAAVAVLAALWHVAARVAAPASVAGPQPDAGRAPVAVAGAAEVPASPDGCGEPAVVAAVARRPARAHGGDGSPWAPPADDPPDAPPVRMAGEIVDLDAAHA